MPEVIKFFKDVLDLKDYRATWYVLGGATFNEYSFSAIVSGVSWAIDLVT